METLAFIVLTVLTIASGLIVALPIVRNAVICALALAFNLVAIAGFFFLLNAQFIGFLQVMVYAGAIMVLILFVLMLLNIRDEQKIGSVMFASYALCALTLPFWLAVWEVVAR